MNPAIKELRTELKHLMLEYHNDIGQVLDALLDMANLSDGDLLMHLLDYRFRVQEEKEEEKDDE